MSQKLENNNYLEVDSDESNKNEEDLLAFSSKYKTTIIKDEDSKEKEAKFQAKKRKVSQDSTSISISQEYSNLSGIPKKLNNIIKDENFEFNELKSKFQDKQRKMSSPLCCYYEGSDKYLSKTQKKIIDIKNSQNYIKKENYFNKSSKIIKHLNKNDILNKEFNNNNLNYNLNYKNNNFFLNNDKDNINNIEQKNRRLLSFNSNQINFDLNYNNIPQQNTNNFFFFNNNYQQQFYNLNYLNLNSFRNNTVNNNRKLSHNIEDGIIDNYFNNLLQINYNPMLFSYNDGQEDNLQFKINKNSSNKSIPNLKNQKDKKPFDKRKGDWLCPDCHNLNFAFRVICNRCQQPKPKDSTVNKEE